MLDLRKTVKILKLNDNKINLEANIETADERNFVGSGINNKKIICGGLRFLSILERSYFFGFSMNQSIDLGGFISNVIEIDSKSFLVGQSNKKRIIIFSKETYKKLYEINNISLSDNNYSLSKISDEFVGIAGYEE